MTRGAVDLADLNGLNTCHLVFLTSEDDYENMTDKGNSSLMCQYANIIPKLANA